MIDCLASYLFIDYSIGHPVEGETMYYDAQIDGVCFVNTDLDIIEIPVNMLEYAVLKRIEDEIKGLKGVE